MAQKYIAQILALYYPIGKINMKNESVINMSEF